MSRLSVEQILSPVGKALSLGGNGAESLSLGEDGIVRVGAAGNQIELNDFMTKSLSSSGYQKLPGGLIIQWGSVANEASTTALTFPIAFPTAVLQMVCTWEYATATTNSTSRHIISKSNTGATINTIDATGSTNYIAIGY
jgi:hypothetical protein